MENSYENFVGQLTSALQSCPIVYINHFHYSLVDEAIKEVLFSEEGKMVFDITPQNKIEFIEFDGGHRHVVDFKSKEDDTDYPFDEETKLIKEIVDMGYGRRPILLFKNCADILKNTEVQCLLSLFASKYENKEFDDPATIILVSPQPASSLPVEIEKFITVIEPKAPSQEEIMDVVKTYEVARRLLGSADQLRQSLCRTLRGLQLYEVKQVLKTAVMRSPAKKLSEKTKEIALKEKKNIVRKSGIIEVIETDVDFDEVGGLEVLKADLERKSVIFNNLDEAEKAKIPLPKGVLILGMPGCGKTMIAKSVAKKFGVSLLRLDISRLMGQYVGQSEENLRRALATAEAAHPCVLWIDEIEKAFAGSNGQNSDMLVMRLMGHFLTWMQERETPIYIVATANDVMRPEFMRKGRFDEVYFVDFPNEKERAQILNMKLNKYRNSKNTIFDFSQLTNVDAIAKKMVGRDKNTNDKYSYGFSGAEIESVVNTVIERKFVEFMDLKVRDKTVTKIVVKNDIFDEVINELKPSVMANHVSKKTDDKDMNLQKFLHGGDKTNIERIRELKEKYNFRDASKTTK